MSNEMRMPQLFLKGPGREIGLSHFLLDLSLLDIVSSLWRVRAKPTSLL